MIEVGILGEIGDTEAALPHDRTDLVPVDLMSHRERNLGSFRDVQEQRLD